MPINFNEDRWEKVKENYALWWEGKLDRPIVSFTLNKKHRGHASSNIPLLSQQTCTDFSYTPEQIVDRLDYELSTKEYIGDAFPWVNLDSFGPGIVAAFCGAVLDNSSGGVWFFPPDDLPDITELHFTYDPNNKWLCRIKDICAAAMKRWKGNVLVGMPDLGGTLDILASFRTTEQLLFDLYDYPEDVKRLTNEINTLWLKYYEEINSVLQPVNPGHTNWSGIYSDKPSYILQSDFSYMISTPMFEEFSKPDLVSLCNSLENVTYHLDGVGELPHLDSLLQIDKLKCVQWVPGDGKPDNKHWPEVYQKIHAAGKKIQLYGSLDSLETVGKQIGDSNGLCLMNGNVDEHYAREYLKMIEA